MSIEIENEARKRLRSPAANSIIQKQLGLDLGRSRQAIDWALSAVVNKFQALSTDTTTRDALHSVIADAGAQSSQRLFNDSQRPAALNDVRRNLETLVGHQTFASLVKELSEQTNLTEDQSRDTFGIASLSVFEAVSDGLTRNSEPPSAAAIASLLAKKHTPPTAARAQSSNTIDALPVNGDSTVTGSYYSSLMRYIIPLVLGGAFLISTVRFCSEVENNQLITQERDALQQDLVTTKKEVEFKITDIDQLESNLQSSNSAINALELDLRAKKSEIDDLNSELHSSRSEIKSLNSDLQSSHSELEFLKDIPTDTAQLQQALIVVTDERNAALKQQSELAATLKETQIDRDQILDQRQSVTLELDEANKKNISNVDLIATLESQVDSLTEARNELKENLQTTHTTLETEKSDSEKAISELLSRAEVLEKRVSQLTQEIENRDNQIALITRERDILSENLTNKNTALSSALTSRETDLNRFTVTTSDLKNQLTQMIDVRDTIQAALRIKDNELAEQAATISALREDNSGLEKLNNESKQTYANIKIDYETLQSEHQVTQDTLSARVNLLSETQNSLAASESLLQSTQDQLEALTRERDELLDTREDLNASLTTAKADSEAASAQVESGNQRYSALNRTLVNVESERATAQIKITDLTDSLRKTQEELNRIDEERDRAKNDLADVKARSAAKEADNNAALKTAEAEINSLSAAYEAVQLERDALEAKAGTLEQEKNTALEKAVFSDQQYDELNIQLTDSISDYQSAKMTIADLEASRDNALTELMDLNVERDRTAEKLEQANAALVLAHQEQSQAEAQISSLQQAQDNQRQALENSKQDFATLKQDQIKQQQAWEDSREDTNTKIALFEKSLIDNNQMIEKLTIERDSLRTAVEKAQAENNKLTERTQDLRQTIEKNLKEAGVEDIVVKTIEGDRAVAITLGSNSLFGVGDASLTRAGGQVINTIGKLVENYPDWRLDVEGHTDAVPIGAALRQRFPSNWELSSARASAVINFLRVTTDISPKTMSAVGYADTRPLADNTQAFGRQQNRRVDIVLRR